MVSPEEAGEIKADFDKALGSAVQARKDYQKACFNLDAAQQQKTFARNELDGAELNLDEAYKNLGKIFIK